MRALQCVARSMFLKAARRFCLAPVICSLAAAPLSCSSDASDMVAKQPEATDPILGEGGVFPSDATTGGASTDGADEALGPFPRDSGLDAVFIPIGTGSPNLYADGAPDSFH
jgi:hypothetical protein